ncbi:hypothetical protein ACFWY6_44295 [Streptomyces sp. NPDC059037]|uniref:hypothetical protein n=1 Tax=Streptomyces sp. NPDC059037 TaxID=3346710 RepID=UPI0036955E4F
MTTIKSLPIGLTAGGTPEVETWLRRCCALVVAGVAAYASVDGLLLLATVGILKPPAQCDRWQRCVVWMAFLLGIAVSLAANIAAAPSLVWKPVLVAG